MNDINPSPNEPEDRAKFDLMTALQGMVEVQSKDTEVRRMELEVRSKEIASNERIALKSIEAQERSQVDGREKYNRHLTNKYVYISVMALIIGGFAMAMVAYGAKDVIIEALKLALAFGGGAFGGYHAGKSKKSEDES
ncbi:hypothetical protein QPK31_23995 [Massilia sp. YIM B02769]|uniref:hypothetical protein n=1 Tax=Massilia sp. YIM B02769 TaxID=3050129 RepID=UPI0025B693BC|nr:hypothetical protein [Massilia sp. YIM B02769]MDN4061286.1 hypothetical protein [Massilia sp. YIM B02769]